MAKRNKKLKKFSKRRLEEFESVVPARLEGDVLGSMSLSDVEVQTMQKFYTALSKLLSVRGKIST